MSGSAPVLRAEGLRKSYRGQTVLDVEHIELPAGKTFALIGPSGSGKSTLLRVLGLLERPDTGLVTADGRRVRSRDTRRLRTAAVFQRPYLFHGSVADNVAYGLRIRGVRRAEVNDRVARALERVGMRGMEGRGALTLSGGEAQRIALARALVIEPRVLLLDEPLSSLDPEVKRELLGDLRDILGGEGPTTLYVTHDQDEALALGDHLGVLREGRLVGRGPTELVMNLPDDPWIASFIGMAPPLRGRVVSWHDGIAEVDIGGTWIAAVSRLAPATDVVLSVRPEDVTLFATAESDALPASSARNRLPGVISGVEGHGSTARVRLDIGPAEIVALVSRAAVAELGLGAGVHVVAAFKATAVHIAPTDGN